MSACCISVAVLLPCLNEEAAIAGVVAAFRQALPDAQVYVYDNGSTDATAKRALEAGAVVRSEPLRGKGNVVRRMFADVEADVYVLADGDGTYDASAAPAMIDRLIAENLDMVVGVRVEAEGQDAYRPGHKMGNALLNRMIRGLFGGVFTDISSGYRVMSRRLVKSFPAVSQRFEIEPELAAHCAHLRLPCAEMPTRYVERPEGGESKLRTLRDGRRALFTIGLLLNPNPPKVWRYSSGMGDEWQRGAMVRAGFRRDGSGGGLSAAAWRPCGRLQTLAGRDGGERAQQEILPDRG